jgi:hypothetical protein
MGMVAGAAEQIVETAAAPVLVDILETAVMAGQIILVAPLVLAAVAAAALLLELSAGVVLGTAAAAAG